MVCIGDGQVLTHGNQLVHLERTVHTSSDVLEVGVLQNTLIVFVSQGHQQGAALCGIAQGEVITLKESRARDIIQPVSVAVTHGLLVVEIAIVPTVDYEVAHLSCGRVIRLDVCALVGMQSQTVVVGILLRIQSVVHGSLSHCSRIFSGVRQLHHRLAAIELSCGIGGEIYFHLVALLSLASGDDNHTIGSTGTVDRSGGSVLQYLH